jgi:hypothetical protein
MRPSDVAKGGARGWSRLWATAIVVPIFISSCSGCQQGDSGQNGHEIAPRDELKANPNHHETPPKEMNAKPKKTDPKR